MSCAASDTRRETFVLPLRDPSNKFRHDSPHTIGPFVEVIVEYGCNMEPRVYETKIRGPNDITFIVGSKYDITALVEKYKKERCELSGCKNAIRYNVTIKFYITLITQLDVLIIAGYLIAGSRIELTADSWDELESYNTTCFCCDEE